MEGAVVIAEIQDSKWNDYLGAVNYCCTTYVYYIENDIPTWKNLKRYVIWKYADDWRYIGLELDLDDETLRKIDIKYKDVKAKFYFTIAQWMIKRGDNAAWKALEIALTNVNRLKLGLYPVKDVYGMITCLLPCGGKLWRLLILANISQLPIFRHQCFTKC